MSHFSDVPPHVHVKFVATADGNRLDLLLPAPRTARVHRSQIELLPSSVTPAVKAPSTSAAAAATAPPLTDAAIGNAKVLRVRLAGVFPSIHWPTPPVHKSRPSKQAGAKAAASSAEASLSELVELDAGDDEAAKLAATLAAMESAARDADAEADRNAEPAIGAAASEEAVGAQSMTPLGGVSLPNALAPSGGAPSQRTWMNGGQPLTNGRGMVPVIDTDHSDLSIGLTVFAFGASPTGKRPRGRVEAYAGVHIDVCGGQLRISLPVHLPALPPSAFIQRDRLVCCEWCRRVAQIPGGDPRVPTSRSQDKGQVHGDGRRQQPRPPAAAATPRTTTPLQCRAHPATASASHRDRVAFCHSGTCACACACTCGTLWHGM